jgi:hypothetical protein
MLAEAFQRQAPSCIVAIMPYAATLRYLLFTGLCLPAFAAAAPLADPVAAGWEFVRRVDDVTLYRKPVTDSRIPALLAHTLFRASAAEVFRTISDYDHFARFIPSVTESRVLQHDAQQIRVYQRLGLPLLIADRHYIIKVIDDLHDADAGNVRVSWQLDRDGSAALPAGRAVVPEDVSGDWRLATPADSTICDAAYSIHVDPGGKVPEWLFTGAAERYVIRVVEAVRKELALRHR